MDVHLNDPALWVHVQGGPFNTYCILYKTLHDKIENNNMKEKNRGALQVTLFI